MKDIILFLCPHGGAKSVIAASYFNRLAEEHALPFVADAGAAEDPYPAVPERVADLLAQDGFDVRTFQPRRVDARELGTAAKIVSIERDWSDVPMVSEDLHGSASAIRRHVTALVEELRGDR